MDLSLAGSVGSALMATGMGLNGNLIIGEWSCALSEDSLRLEENPIASRRQFCEVQEKTYRDVGAGAAFWSEWSNVQYCGLSFDKVNAQV